MHLSRMRRLGAIIGVAGLATLAGTAIAAPASADQGPVGIFYFKPAGSSYFTYNASVAQGVAPGGSTTLQVKLVNAGDAAGQFEISVDQFNGAFSPEGLYPPPTVTMSVNGKAVPTTGWITPVLQPGAGQVVSVKVALQRTVNPSGGYGLNMDVSAPGSAGGSAQFFSVYVAQDSGSSAADVFVKSYPQPFVGGWVFGTPPNSGDYPNESLNVLKHGMTGTATVRLQNGSTTAGPIGLRADDLCTFDTTSALSRWPITVMDGLKNVTATVVAGTYRTPSLAPNAHRDLRLTVKNNANPTCPSGQIILTTSGQGETMVAGILADDAV